MLPQSQVWVRILGNLRPPHYPKRELAERTGLPYARLLRLINRGGIPTLHEAERLADHCGMQIIIRQRKRTDGQSGPMD